VYNERILKVTQKKKTLGRNHKNRIVSEVVPVYENKDCRQKMLRVAGYTRVSTDSSDQENSLNNQKDHYETTIRANPNWEYVGLYVDDGISGTSTRNRKDFNRMIEDSKAGRLDLIVVKDVSRFARNIVDCLNTVQLLLTLDPPVGVYFENNNLNTLEANNIIFLATLAMCAELESELKSKSVKFGNNRCFENGNYFCPANLLGYEKDGKYGIKIEPEGAKTVRLIYDLFLAGYSTKEISDVMTSLSRPTAKGNLIWSPSSVHGILKNEKYCGDFIMQKTFVKDYKTQKTVLNKGQRKLFYEPDHHEGIVSRAEHARSLLLLKSDQASSFFDNRFVIKVIRQGLLSGFIPMNPAFGGYNASHYLCALETARIPFLPIETEVAHIAGAKLIRRELFCNRYAAVIFSEHGLHFNTTCVSLMKEIAYVEMLLHPSERLFAVRKTAQRNRNAIPWKPLPVRARELAQIVYQLMGWQKEWKYKVSANCFFKFFEMVIFFDLVCCEFQFRKDKKLTKAIPKDWISEFGEDIPDHMMLCRRAMAETLANWKLSASSSLVNGFELGISPLTREQAEKRITEMRCAREKE
jgi:DNA invertase Pin-like site-specific DNA recombinase